MKIHHIRNATFAIESHTHTILVDPMLGKKGSLPPFSYFRFKRMKNPTVELPPQTPKILEKVNACLITHCQTFGFKALQHTDHLDAEGEKLLIQNKIATYSGQKEVAYLRKLGLNVQEALYDWEMSENPVGKMLTVPAKHGHGWNHKLMSNGYGIYLELPNEPSLYISGDTVLTPDVRKALKSLNPDIAVVACGSAQLDVGPPILMNMEEIIEFIKFAPNKVICNHLEALNHCPTTRAGLKQELKKRGLLEKVAIPEDGEILSY